jgi:hypothetical protein
VLLFWARPQRVDVLAWMRKHKFEAHSIAFLLMTIPPILLYLVAQSGARSWIIPLLVGRARQRARAIFE